MDLMIFEANHLRGLRTYLEELYGNRAFSQILPVSCSTLDAKSTFGEWTFYAVYILDVLRKAAGSKLRQPVRSSSPQRDRICRI